MKPQGFLPVLFLTAALTWAQRTPVPQPIPDSAKPEKNPPPVFVAPTTPAGRVETSVVLTTNLVIVTNAVPFTGVALVTNAMVVTNATLVSTIIPGPTYVYEQRLAVERPVLVTPEQETQIIDHFRGTYASLGHPRMLLSVKRVLADDQPGLKPAREGEPAPKLLADKQTLNEVEQRFARPFCSAGAVFSDQQVTALLIGNHSVKELLGSAESPVAVKNREALLKVADIAIEVLVTLRHVTAAGLSGDQTYVVPDFQATATRLNDARVLGQATSAEYVGQGNYAGLIARHYGVPDIAEVTALLLMENIMTGLNRPAVAPR